MIECRLNATYPECSWSLERGLIDSRAVLFTCYDVPETAVLTYTITPQTDPPEDHPTYSVNFWGSNETVPIKALSEMWQLQDNWVRLKQDERKLLPVEPTPPLNVDDLDDTYGALDFSNTEKMEEGLLISETAIPWESGNAHYSLWIVRDPRTAWEHCLDILSTVSIN
jgi:hypothetical protein